MLERFWHRVSFRLPLVPFAALRERTSLARLCSWIIRVCLGAVMLLLPIVFAPWTVEPLDLPKQLFLVCLTGMAGVAWFVRAFLERRLSIARHWLHAAVAAFGIIYLISTLLSEDRYASFLGGGQEASSFLTLAACLIFFALLVHEVQSTKEVYNDILVFLIGSFFVALTSVPALFDWNIGFLSKQTTLVGSYYSLAAFLVAPILMASAVAFHGCRNNVCFLGEVSWRGRASRLFLWALMGVSVALLIIIDFWLAWALLAIGTVLLVSAAIYRAKTIHHPTRLAVPGILLGVSLFFLFFKAPVRLTLPVEVSPSFAASFHIGVQALQEHPLLGTGPGTWVYQYSKFRQPSVNQSPFWQTRFDHATSAFLTNLSTVGIVGTLLWLLVIGLIIVHSGFYLFRERNDDVWYAYVCVFAAWISLIVFHFFYPLRVTHVWLFWFLTGLLGAMMMRELAVFETTHKPWKRLVVAGVGVVFVGGVLFGAQYAVRRFASEILFKQAVGLYQNDPSVERVLPLLQRARRLNPWDELYPRNLAQAHMLRVLARIQTAPLAEKEAIQNELKQSLALAEEAAAAAPGNVESWSNLATIYASAARFTQGADAKAEEYYREAIKREPWNPVFWDELGSLHLVQSELVRPYTQGKNDRARADAIALEKQKIEQAQKAFEQSIAMKPDYMPAHYHLGQVYQRQGRLPEAIEELSKVLQVRNRDVGLAFELALLFARSNQVDSALSLLEQVVKADAESVNARWYLALLYEQKGRLEEAREQLIALIGLVPDNLTVQDRLGAINKAIEDKKKPAPQPLPEPIKETVKTRGRKVIR